MPANAGADMMHPTPSGTRDVLPDEMRELRAMTHAMRATFEARGYGEVYTPALEYERAVAGGAVRTADPAYRLFDEHGEVFVLRADMTIPIARVVGTRYQSAEPPLRFCYIAHAYRSVRPKRGEAREMLQAGIELVGMPGPEGTAEALGVLCDALTAAGLERYRIGLGDAALVPALLGGYGLDSAAVARVQADLSRRDFVALAQTLTDLDLAPADAALVARVAQTRGGVDVLSAPDEAPVEAFGDLRRVYDLLAPAVAERVIFDLGLTQRLGYYTGAVFEVYDAALGAPLGGGGHYDDLLASYGRPLPAVGWALNVERLHLAWVAERRGLAWR